MSPTFQTLRQKLASQKPVIGIWSIIPSPTLAEIIGMAGMDFQILDREHGFYDLATLESSIRACDAVGCAPLVRMADPTPAAIQSVLDLGAQGVLMPQLTSCAAAQDFLRSLQFGPRGTRGLNPFTRAGRYGEAKVPEESVLAGVLIENRALYDQMDELLALPELDFIYLGVYDMSVALGVPGEVDHPSVAEFVTDAIIRARKAGKTVGVMAKTEEEIARYVNQGANLIVYAVDTYVIRQAMQIAVQSLHRIASE